jgi:hypothetical protein
VPLTFRNFLTDAQRVEYKHPHGYQQDRQSEIGKLGETFDIHGIGYRWATVAAVVTAASFLTIVQKFMYTAF